MHNRKLELEKQIDKITQDKMLLEDRIKSITPKIKKWLSQSRPKHISDAIARALPLIERAKIELENAEKSLNLKVKEQYLISRKELLIESVRASTQEIKTHSASMATLEMEADLLNLKNKILYKAFQESKINQDDYDSKVKVNISKYQNILCQLEKYNAEKKVALWGKAIAESKLRQFDRTIQDFSLNPQDFKVDEGGRFYEKMKTQATLFFKFSELKDEKKEGTVQIVDRVRRATI